MQQAPTIISRYYRYHVWIWLVMMLIPDCSLVIRSPSHTTARQGAWQCRTNHHLTFSSPYRRPSCLVTGPQVHDGKPRRRLSNQYPLANKRRRKLSLQSLHLLDTIQHVPCFPRPRKSYGHFNTVCPPCIHYQDFFVSPPRLAASPAFLFALLLVSPFPYFPTRIFSLHC